MKYDIKVNGNFINGRQGWAYICNSMDYKVLKADMVQGKTEFEGFSKFDKVGVIYSYKNIESAKIGTLEVEKGRWFIGCGGTCITASFGYSDMKELIENANAPKVRENEIVAVAIYNDEYELAYIQLFRIGRVDIHCSTMTELTPLTDEEMEEIKQKAIKWCNR